MAADRLDYARMLASAKARRALGETKPKTPDEISAAVRGILSRHAPDPPPDPLTGKVIESPSRERY